MRPRAIDALCWIGLVLALLIGLSSFLCAIPSCARPSAVSLEPPAPDRAYVATVRFIRCMPDDLTADVRINAAMIDLRETWDAADHSFQFLPTEQGRKEWYVVKSRPGGMDPPDMEVFAKERFARGEAIIFYVERIDPDLRLEGTFIGGRGSYPGDHGIWIAHPDVIDHEWGHYLGLKHSWLGQVTDLPSAPSSSDWCRLYEKKPFGGNVMSYCFGDKETLSPAQIAIANSVASHERNEVFIRLPKIGPARVKNLPVGLSEYGCE